MSGRRLAVIGLTVVFGALFVTQFGELTDVVGAVRSARPRWMLVALALQLLWFVNQAALYQAIYAWLELPARIPQLLPIVLASNFVNFVTPSASLGAVPLFLHDAEQRGLDTGKAALASVLRLLLNLVWFSLLLAFSLTTLFVWNALRIYHLVAASILLASALVLVAALITAGVHPDRLARLLRAVTSLVNRLSDRLLKRALVKESTASGFATYFGHAAVAVWHGRRRMVRPWIHTMAFDALQMSVLYATVRAFPGAVPSITLTMLVTAYTIGVLFSVVAITPQGVGAVEGVLVAALTSYGMSVGRATAVVIAYRGLSFWLPLVAGFSALRWVRGLGKPVAQEKA